MIASLVSAAESAAVGPVPLLAAAPFVLLLLAISSGPLLAPRQWHHHYPKVALSLGAVVALYYVFVRNAEGHGWHKLGHAGVEYVSFVALIGSLFVIASGVLLRIKARGTTMENVVLLAIASVLANVLGTTGASMLLIRPFLRMNQGHLGAHHVVFFIFLVANVGGALTPIGDPPLFLGYLRGVPFFWTSEALIGPWCTAVTYLLVAFAIVDTMHARRMQRAYPTGERLRLDVTGIRSFLYLFGVLGLVFVQRQPFVQQHTPWSTVAVAAGMLGLAAAAYFTTPRDVHEANDFTFEPIREVGILFAGIFTTMIPALEYLEEHAAEFGLTRPIHFYFSTGILSATLDNAPTYLTFLTTELALNKLSVDDPVQILAHLGTVDGAHSVAAISAAAVFFGAMTYIGNGPNFMVKSIAESARIPVPTFFGYLLRWAVPILGPILVLVGFLFYR